MFYFDEKQSTPLCEIMGRHKSDKGNINITDSWHNYTTFYYSIFEKLQEKNLRIFELGLGTNNPNLPSNMGVNGRPGASLYGWMRFFPNAKVYGADIDRDILFQTDRIKTYYCDQLNPVDIKTMWSNTELWEPFDIIIEDGLHEFKANVCFFENSIFKLKRTGYYIIEDLIVTTLPLWGEKIKEWKIIYPELNFKLVKIPNIINNWDNNLLIVTYNI